MMAGLNGKGFDDIMHQLRMQVGLNQIKVREMPDATIPSIYIVLDIFS